MNEEEIEKEQRYEPHLSLWFNDNVGLHNINFFKISDKQGAWIKKERGGDVDNDVLHIQSKHNQKTFT